MATRYNYTGGIVTNGLVLNLDAAKTDSYPGTGTIWRDLSGFGNNGTLTNGPTFSGPGKQASIVFDGVNDYASITNNQGEREKWSSLWATSNKMTISGFVKINTTPSFGLRFGIIGNRYYYDTGYFNFHIHNNTPSQFVLAYNNGYNANFVLGPSIIDYRNQWIFISVRHNGDTTTNAVRFSINTSFSNHNLSNSVPIGVYMSGTSFNVVIAREQNYNYVDISSISVYNRYLSDSEIIQNYNATKGRFGL